MDSGKTMIHSEMKPTPLIGLFIPMLMFLPSAHADLVVPVTDANVQNGLSPFNWVRKSDCLLTISILRSLGRG
jgi:hypothetical protein